MFILISTILLFVNIIGKRYPRIFELIASFKYFIQASVFNWVYNVYLNIWDLICGGVRPPRSGDKSVNHKWLNNLLHARKLIPEEISLVDVKIDFLNNNRGLANIIYVLKLAYNKESPNLLKTLLMKTNNNETIRRRYTNVACGTYREAFFYDKYSNIGVLPNIIYSYASPIHGCYIIIMEDLRSESTGVNFYFGNQVWGTKELEKSKEPEIMLKNIYLKAASMHAKYWNDKTLLDNKWLKAVNWYAGKDRASWSMGLKRANQLWIKAKSKINSNDVKWSPKLISIIDKSFENTTWEKLQEQLNDSKTPFTLTHGDFHASNMLYLFLKDEIVWVDWSEIGIWEPMADIGQIMISDIKIDVRRKHERELVRAYWDHLISCGVSPNEYTFEQCWKSYQRSPIERWIWMFAILTGFFDLPANAVQYFHDQVLSFIEDHSDEPFYILRPIACFI